MDIKSAPRWHDEALCTGHPDPDLWFYDNTRHDDEQKLAVLRTVQAIELCNICPVRMQCLEQGLEDENLDLIGETIGSGSVWGGLMTSERILLCKKRSATSNRVRREDRHRRQVRSKIARIDK